MDNYAVLADITCDLSPLLRTRFQVDGIVGGYFTTPQGKQIAGRLDLTEDELNAFYSDLRANKKGYSTAAASVPEIQQTFEGFLQQGRDVLALSISGRLSATYNLMVNAAELCRERYPQRRVEVVDSLKYSAALGLLTIQACKLRTSGKPLSEAVETILSLRSKVHQMGSVDDLFWVASKGRISHAKAFFGTVAGVKSLGDFDNEGMVTPLASVTGFDKVYSTTVEYIRETIEPSEDQIVLVAHSDRRAQAQEMASRIRDYVKVEEVLVTDIYPSSGVNIGPGLCAAYYVGREITDLAFEKQLINGIVLGRKPG